LPSTLVASGLVGGDVQEALDAVLLGRRQDVPGAQGVGLPALQGVLLQHGEVLQGGRMEDDVGPVVGEDLVEGLDVPDIAQDHVGSVQ